MMNERDAHNQLLKFIGTFETQREAAEALGISQQFLSDITKARRYRNVPDRVLKGMGFRRVTNILRIKKRRNGKNGASANL